MLQSNDAPSSMVQASSVSATFPAPVAHVASNIVHSLPPAPAAIILTSNTATSPIGHIITSTVNLSSVSQVSSPSMSFGSNSASTSNTVHFIGQMSNPCPYYSALIFPNESLNCCHSGKVQLTTDAYPDELRSLFTNTEFLKNICLYNNIFAFAPLGAKLSPPPGYGPYCFRIHFQVYHRSGSLHLQDGETRQYGPQ